MSAQTPVDEFISQSPIEVRAILSAIQQKISSAVPDTIQVISYGIPTFQLHGKNLLHFGYGKYHIGLYATPDGHAEFEAELNQYKRGKGSVQFPIDQPIPYDLIVRIAVYRAKQLTKGEK